MEDPVPIPDPTVLILGEDGTEAERETTDEDEETIVESVLDTSLRLHLPTRRVLLVKVQRVPQAAVLLVPMKAPKKKSRRKRLRRMIRMERRYKRSPRMRIIK